MLVENCKVKEREGGTYLLTNEGLWTVERKESTIVGRKRVENLSPPLYLSFSIYYESLVTFHNVDLPVVLHPSYGPYPRPRSSRTKICMTWDFCLPLPFSGGLLTFFPGSRTFPVNKKAIKKEVWYKTLCTFGTYFTGDNDSRDCPSFSYFRFFLLLVYQFDSIIFEHGPKTFRGSLGKMYNRKSFK